MDLTGCKSLDLREMKIYGGDEEMADASPNTSTTKKVVEDKKVAGSGEPATLKGNAGVDETVLEYVMKCLGKESVDNEVLREALLFQQDMESAFYEERVEDEPFLSLSDEELEKEEEGVME